MGALGFRQAASGADSGGECGVPTLLRFPHFPSLAEMWYSFEVVTPTLATTLTMTINLTVSDPR